MKKRRFVHLTKNQPHCECITPKNACKRNKSHNTHWNNKTTECDIEFSWSGVCFWTFFFFGRNDLIIIIKMHFIYKGLSRHPRTWSHVTPRTSSVVQDKINDRWLIQKQVLSDPRIISDSESQCRSEDSN